mgnify:CR=1 FL=1
MSSNLKMLGVGIDVNGHRKEYLGVYSIFAGRDNLISFEISPYANYVYVFGNNLKSINIPETVLYIACDKELFNYEDNNYSVLKTYKE